MAGSDSSCRLRVNHGGVMPIIFAQSLMLFPSDSASAKLAEWTAPVAGQKGTAIYSVFHFVNDPVSAMADSFYIVT